MIEDTMFDNDCYAVFMEEEHEKEKRVRDNISRQAAIDALADYIHNVDRVIGTGHLSADDCKDAAISVLADLPSADRPTGEWEHDVDGHFFCTNCKKYPEYQVRMSDYCPNCGADMRG